VITADTGVFLLCAPGSLETLFRENKARDAVLALGRERRGGEGGREEGGPLGVGEGPNESARALFSSAFFCSYIFFNIRLMHEMTSSISVRNIHLMLC